MADKISADIGDDASGVAAGKGINQSRQQANPSQSTNFYGGGDGPYQWIIAQLIDHASQLRALAEKLDDLPNKFGGLERRVDVQADKMTNQDSRTTKLEAKQLEVVIRPSEVVVRPIAPPDTPVLTMRALAAWVSVGFVVILLMVAYLIYLQAVRGG